MQAIKQPLLLHLIELRKRLFYSLIAMIPTTCVSFYYYSSITDFLFTPFREKIKTTFTHPFVMSSLYEGFLVKLKIALITGLILAFPLLMYQMLRFIFPGLRKKEKWVLSLVLFCSFGLFIGSFYLCYYHMIPLAIQFLTSSGFIPSDVGIMLNFQLNVTFMLQLILCSLIVFQLPLLTTLLMALNLLSRPWLFKSSRLIIITILILSAIVTPPDLISQVILATPLTLLFFISIGIAKIFKWGEL